MCNVWQSIGLQFQERIRLNEAGNVKFNFLNPTDPYHAYYQHKINEIKEGKVGELMNANFKVLVHDLICTFV